MPDRRLGPQRFRRRLIAAFVLVAAMSAGTLAVVTYAIASSTRWNSIERSSRSEASVAIALAPRTLDGSTFDRFITASERRGGAETVAVNRSGQAFSTSPLIDPAMVAAPGAEADELTRSEVRIGTTTYYVYNGRGPDEARYSLLFPVDQVEAGLADLRTTLVGTWLTVVVVALAVGALVARRTLRPVRDAARAAAEIADGSFGARLAATGDDEFAALAHSFNTMADALEARIDELAEAAERERRFTADAAHDLRTPLTGLSVTGTLLLERLSDLPQDLRRPVELHAQAIDRLGTLALELLELHRDDATSIPVDVEEIEVARALTATLDSLHLPDGATISLEVPPSLSVLAERSRLKRILSNLILNSTTHGGGDVAIVARPCGADVEIAISDRGPGIPTGAIDVIFDRFWKGDSSRSAGGSGLGLAIARSHARVLGGSLTAGNLPCGGACFTLTLPRAVVSRLAAGQCLRGFSTSSTSGTAASPSSA